MNKDNITRFKPNIATAIKDTLIRRIPPKSSSPYLEDIVNLLMDALNRGEIYTDIIESAPSIELKEDGWPTKHVKELKKSGWLDGDHSPIVLTKTSISWRRWHDEMKNILNDLKNRSSLNPINIAAEKQSKYNYQSLNLNDKQISAVNSITSKNLILISGGPGTGKTSTIVEILIKAISFKSDLKIGLAAPTGKAARKLEISIEKAVSNLKQDHKEVLLKIPCLTIHKWLQATDGGFKRCKANQLQIDLLIVDEMSMVDLHLMKGMLNALPVNSQLILVGDPHQLPPVGNGSVWHAIHAPGSDQDFSNCSFHLNKLYRNRGDIANLANVIRMNDMNTLFSKLMLLSSLSNVKVLVRDTGKIPYEIIQIIKNHQKKLIEIINQGKRLDPYGNIKTDYLSDHITADKLLHHLENLMVLCPRRYGQWSIEHIHKEILGTKLDEGFLSWPEGTPVICGENQPELNLSNGDIGVIIGEGKYKRLIFQASPSNIKGKKQFIHPARIKKLDPAYALTIHKAQGSESSHVICLWPEPMNDEQLSNQKSLNNKNQNYEKKLIYTAITRAKTKLVLAISL